MAVEQAADLGRAYGADRLLLHVTADEVASEIYPPTPAVDLDRYFGSLVESFPDLAVQTRQDTGDPGRLICSVAEEEAVDVMCSATGGPTPPTAGTWGACPTPSSRTPGARCSWSTRGAGSSSTPRRLTPAEGLPQGV
jgi:hypothetical protein